MAGKLKLLVPIDFSEQDDILFQFFELAKKRGEVEVTFLHLLIPPTLPAFELAAIDYVQSYLTGLREGVEKQFVQLRQHPALAGLEIHTLLVDSPVHSLSQELAQQAEAHHVDFIITLSKHRRGLEYLISGSELMRIIQRSPVPVIVLSPGTTPKINRILYATDFTPASAEIFLRLTAFAAHFGAIIYLAKISTPADFETTRQFQAIYREFVEELSTLSLEAREFMQESIHYVAEELPLGIQQCAEDHLCDVIALATHGRRGFNLLLNGSITQEVIETNQLPLLVYPIRDLDEQEAK